MEALFCDSPRGSAKGHTGWWAGACAPLINLSQPVSTGFRSAPGSLLPTGAARVAEALPWGKGAG